MTSYRLKEMTMKTGLLYFSVLSFSLVDADVVRPGDIPNKYYNEVLPVVIDESSSSSSSSSSSQKKGSSSVDDDYFASTNYHGVKAKQKECTLNGTCQKQFFSSNNGDDQEEVECGIWLAESSLPGAGIGVFAGRSVEHGSEMVAGMGDHIIPIIDLSVFHDDLPFLWSDYTWGAKYLRVENLGMAVVHVHSPGFATANCVMDFVNVHEGLASHSIVQGLHRSKDPGAGAFTPYHSRKVRADANIGKGQEIFVSYSDAWFKFDERKQEIGPIPVTGDHKKAQNLFNSYQKLKKELPDSAIAVLDNAWDIFVLDSSWSSRVFFALKDKKDYEKINPEDPNGLLTMKKQSMTRSDDWLKEHGVCADNFFTDESTMPQAGHGAFAKRFLKEGSVVLPVPLIHIPDRKVMEIYKFDREMGMDIHDIVGYQLLLNYCLGHRDSPVLLTPYGPAFNLINHNQTQANVRLQWASPERSNHHPEMLEKTFWQLGNIKSTKLAMELVALRDIQPNEEIFLDYGDEWENAWQEHVRTWKPVAGAENYISALEMDERQEPLRTEFEQMENPYPPNLTIRFDRAFLDYSEWIVLMSKGEDLKAWSNKIEAYLDSCEILRYKEVDGRILYTAAIPEEHESDEYILVKNVPREAFMFVDRAYTSDIFLPNAFRHDIRIPDDMFPEAWKTSSNTKF